MRATDNNMQWAHVGNMRFLTFLSTDVLIYGDHTCLKFLNMITSEEMIMVANRHSVNGDGIGAVRGHRSIHTFAYCETIGASVLYVKEYPSLRTIVEFKDCPREGYCNLAFSETSLIIALGGIPNFVITIWNWRKKQKLGELASNISMENQMLRCSWSKPVSMVQLGKGSDELFLWDVFTCCRTAVLAKHELKFHKKQFDLAQFNDCVWTTEGNLYVVDVKGCIYTLNSELHLELEVQVELEGNAPTTVSLYKSGIAVSGPNNEIRHYIKNISWECDWKIALDVGMERMFCNRTDYLVGLTLDQQIIRITKNTITHVKPKYFMFNDIGLVYPTGEYIAALRENKFLNIYATNDGREISLTELSGKALALSENPELPYIAIGFENGTLELMSIYKAEHPTVMTSFYLTKSKIENVKFFERGRLIVAGCSEIGEFFIIEGLPGSQMTVKAAIHAGHQIADFMLVASKNCYRLFLIPVTENCLAGNKIIRYCILGKDNINVKEYTLENDSYFYGQLIPTTTSTRDRIFYALPLNSRQIHILETKRGDPQAKIISQIKTGHQMRKFGLRITKHYAVTWGYDGFIFARDHKFEKRVGMALPHHRYTGGVKKAYIDPLGKFIISLGQENCLICTDIVANEIDGERKKYLTELKDSVKFALMFKRPTLGFKPEKQHRNKTWLEVEQILRYEREQELCKVARHDILFELTNIKRRLMDLVTKNLEGPENEKLDLQEFYLDTGMYHQLKNQNRDDCRHTEIYLKALIVAQDKVTQHLLDTYWNPMKLTGKACVGFFVNTMTSNYILLPVIPERERLLAWSEEQRKVEKFLSMKGSFMPWYIRSEEEVLELVRKPKLPTEDYNNINVLKLMEELDVKSPLSVENQQAIAGVVTSKYIECSAAHYPQKEIVTFFQCNIQQVVAEFDIIKLKIQYNKQFEDLVGQKYRESSFITERNARLRHIISEVNYFSCEKINLVIADPTFNQREEPERLLKVTDEEMSVTPYISPSEQAILDAKAAEDERIRLALLADDFKERALMAMMNGVLEVRWEDELKRDVPIPKCMHHFQNDESTVTNSGTTELSTKTEPTFCLAATCGWRSFPLPSCFYCYFEITQISPFVNSMKVEKEKLPEQYNEEDLRTVRDYEEKVTFLCAERERYKNLLDNEFTRISTNLRDLIRKFNQKVKDTLEHKMDIDSALNQENLTINRKRWKQNLRIKTMNSEEQIQYDFKQTEGTIEELRTTISTLNESLNECRLETDVYLTKDKLLEKTFKKEIQDMTTIVQEQALKLYKKRPKTVFSFTTTSACYNELARSIVSSTRSLILTDDCLEFLKYLDQMDLFINLPPPIDENTYKIICRHRRLKIEFEIQVKAYQTQISDGELTINAYHKRLIVNKEKHARLQSQLQQVRIDYRYLLHNIQIQIVLRRGLVEVPLTGHVHDFSDAILIPKYEIENINKLIKEAGKKKIHAIMRNMAFRRNIMVKEWEHQKLRMQINDFIEQLNDITGVQFTKEMQTFLKAKALGRKITHDTAESEIDKIMKAYQKRIEDKKEKVGRIKKQMQSYKDHNDALDKAIKNVNIDVCDLKLQIDTKLKEKENKALQSRMEALLKRSTLVQQIQNNHNEILILQTELELLRLKTYPTFKYKLINT